MLGYTREDLDNARYGIRLALEALSPNPPRFDKDDLKRIQGLARDGLKITQDMLDGLDSEGYFD